MFGINPLMMTPAAMAISRPQDVFKTVLAPANAMQAAIDGLSFSPDLLIDKDRIGPTDWSWRDSLRGLTASALASNSNAASAAWGGYSGANNRVVQSLKRAHRFFDIAAWTGDGKARTIPHALGVEPGLFIVKHLSGANDWFVYHRSLGASALARLNTTAAISAGINLWSNTSPSATGFSIGNFELVNSLGETYEAYVFAHDPDPSGVVLCDSFTTSASGVGSFSTDWNGVQFAMIKCASAVGDWEMFDTSRSPLFSGNDARLRPNLSTAEDSLARVSQTSGTLSFSGLSASQTYIGLFIRSPIL